VSTVVICLMFPHASGKELLIPVLDAAYHPAAVEDCHATRFCDFANLREGVWADLEWG